jgi:hypothetical protein
MMLGRPQAEGLDDLSHRTERGLDVGRRRRTPVHVVVAILSLALSASLAPWWVPGSRASDPPKPPPADVAEPADEDSIGPVDVDGLDALTEEGVPPAPAPRVTSASALDHSRACEAQSKFRIETAEEVMAGRLTMPPFGTVTIDPERDGNVNWYMNPFKHPSWVLYYRGGDWVQVLVDRYLQGGPNAAAYRTRAGAYLRDWLRDVPIGERNASTLICVARAFPGEAWIEGAIPPQVDLLATTWSGAWNHGMFEDLRLLKIGCGYPAGAWGGKPVFWRERARARMLSALEPNSYGPAIDDQGASNEQSTAYTALVRSLWTRGARRLEQCGYAVPAKWTDRLARMPTFIAHSIMPTGTWAQLGDTYGTQTAAIAGTPVEYAATRGASGSPPAENVRIYAAGYVFGRSGWGTAQPVVNESYYTLRFGPRRQIHGHDDHMALTWYARGRELLVDSGHTGYEHTAYRQYLKSPEAHNVLTMPGVRLNESASTTLRRSAVSSSGAFYEFHDTAYGGRPRTRSVYVAHSPDIAVVFDRASGANQYRQHWHLHPTFNAVVHSRSFATATSTDGTSRMSLFQVPLPGQTLPVGSTRVVKGQTNPYQGWVSHAPLHRAPAPVVTMTRTGGSTAMLTLIVAANPVRRVTYELTRRPDGWYSLKVRIGTTVTEFHVSPGGYIRRR